VAYRSKNLIDQIALGARAPALDARLLDQLQEACLGFTMLQGSPNEFACIKTSDMWVDSRLRAQRLLD
jgi:hypothetical protein